MNEPILSIIIPCYNCSSYLDACLLPLVDMDLSYEIILVNDGSTDNTEQRLSKYAKYENIIIVNQKNRGVSATRNVGIDIAKGKYIMFCDSDDYYDSSVIEKMVTVMQNEDVDYVVTPIQMLINQESIKYSVASGVFKTGDFLETIFYQTDLICISGPCAQLYKRDIILNSNIRFIEDMDLGEDTMFNLAYLKCCKKIAGIDEISYYYVRQNENSLYTKFNPKCYEFSKIVCDEMLKLFQINQIHNVEMFKHFFYALYGSLIKIAQQKGEVLDKYIHRFLSDSMVLDSVEYLEKTLKNAILKKAIQYRWKSVLKYIISMKR